MNKRTKKRLNYNTQAVNATAKFFDYTDRYVRKCIRGDAKGIMPDMVTKKYKEICRSIEKSIETKINQL